MYHSKLYGRKNNVFFFVFLSVLYLTDSKYEMELDFCICFFKSLPYLP